MPDHQPQQLETAIRTMHEVNCRSELASADWRSAGSTAATGQRVWSGRSSPDRAGSRPGTPDFQTLISSRAWCESMRCQLGPLAGEHVRARLASPAWNPACLAPRFVPCWSASYRSEKCRRSPRRWTSSFIMIEGLREFVLGTDLDTLYRAYPMSSQI